MSTVVRSRAVAAAIAALAFGATAYAQQEISGASTTVAKPM